MYFFTQMKCVAMKAKRMKATVAPLLVVQKWLSSCKNYENGHTAVHNLWSLKSCISEQSSHAESLADSCERLLSCADGRTQGNFPSRTIQCILSCDSSGLWAQKGLRTETPVTAELNWEELSIPSGLTNDIVFKVKSALCLPCFYVSWFPEMVKYKHVPLGSIALFLNTVLIHKWNQTWRGIKREPQYCPLLITLLKFAMNPTNELFKFS